MNSRILLLSAALCSLSSALSPAFAQGTAFTYQGQLIDNGNPANGTYDLTFIMFATNTGGVRVATPVTNSAVTVTDGLFTVTIDFGAAAWNGATNWLQIGVETNGGGGAFTTLSPRQRLTPTPYAIFSEGASAAGLSGTIPTSSLSGTYSGAVSLSNPGNVFSGSGAGLTLLNASQLTSGTVPSAALNNAWKLLGNTGANPASGFFVGTTDNNPLELRVNGSRGFRLQPNTNGGPAVIAGSVSNSIDPNVPGAAIGGGEDNYIQQSASDSAIAGGISNQVLFLSIASVIAGGMENTMQPASSLCSIGGGILNQMDGNDFESTIVGGQQNELQQLVQYSSINGGFRNQMQLFAAYSSINGGYENTIGNNVSYSALGGGQFNTLAANLSVLGGGFLSSIASNSDYSVIAGGSENRISGGSTFAFIGGGNVNVVDSNAVSSTIGGGLFNFIQPGAQYSFIGGGDNNHEETNASYAAIAGGSNNNIDDNAQDSAILGGQLNEIGASAQFSMIGGGDGNLIGAFSFYTTIAGGGDNFAGAEAATIGGGIYHNASGFAATVSGGETNGALNDYATVGGGYGNFAQGYASTVPGGFSNIAAGPYSFAAGVGAQAQYDGSFVWADDSGGTFASTADNQFAVRASGGLVFAGDVALAGGARYHNLSLSGGNSTGYLYGSYPALGDGIHLGYNYYYDAFGIGHPINAGGATSRLSIGYGSIGMYFGNVDSAPSTQILFASSSGVSVYGTFNNFSDRNSKQDFAPVSSSQILDEVTRLPVSEWSYKTDPHTRHIGPVAQDFYSAFNIGTDDRHIAPIDEGGVALAAIQGLNQKVEEQRAELMEKRAEIAELKQRLDALEKAVLNQK